MDENGSAEDRAQDREVFAESRYYLLVSTPEGWGVWDRTLSSDEPVAFFPADEDGYDRAAAYFANANRTARFRRWSSLDLLRRVAYISGVTWVIANAIVNVWFNLSSGFEGGPFLQLAIDPTRWLRAVADIASPIFFVAVGVYVLTWLRSRERP